MWAFDWIMFIKGQVTCKQFHLNSHHCCGIWSQEQGIFQDGMGSDLGRGLAIFAAIPRKLNFLWSQSVLWLLWYHNVPIKYLAFCSQIMLPSQWFDVVLAILLLIFGTVWYANNKAAPYLLSMGFFCHKALKIQNERMCVWESLTIFFRCYKFQSKEVSCKILRPRCLTSKYFLIF